MQLVVAGRAKKSRPRVSCSEKERGTTRTVPDSGSMGEGETMSVDRMHCKATCESRGKWGLHTKDARVMTKMGIGRKTNRRSQTKITEVSKLAALRQIKRGSIHAAAAGKEMD